MNGTVISLDKGKDYVAVHETVSKSVHAVIVLFHHATTLLHQQQAIFSFVKRNDPLKSHSPIHKRQVVVVSRVPYSHSPLDTINLSFSVTKGEKQLYRLVDARDGASTAYPLARWLPVEIFLSNQTG